MTEHLNDWFFKIEMFESKMRQQKKAHLNYKHEPNFYLTSLFKKHKNRAFKKHKNRAFKNHKNRALLYRCSFTVQV